MTYKKAVAARYFLYLNIKMIFFTVLGFSTLLSANATCQGDVSHRNSPLQVSEMIRGTKSSLTDRLREEIIEVLNTGRPKPNQDFQQLLTHQLLLNLSCPISDIDLGLLVSALVARRDNPRIQNGIDILADLLARVNAASRPQPYLVLTLCNARAVTHEHLEKIVRGISPRSNYTNVRDLDLDSLILKALACAATLPNAHQQKLDQFTNSMVETAKKISSIQRRNGYFDNIYTTSLVVQALTAYNRVTDAALEWGEKETLDSLRKESTTGSVTKMYYLSMALNARRIPFLKDLHDGEYDSQITLRSVITLMLAIKHEGVTEVDFAVRLKVPSGWNLYEVLLRTSNYSSRFRFLHSPNKNGEPNIVEFDNTPHDPEKGLYWTICASGKHIETPTLYVPYDGETITLWYRSTDCPV